MGIVSEASEASEALVILYYKKTETS